MKEHILEFRKLVEVLLATKALNKQDIIKVLGLSWPTVDRLINEDINTIKPRASVLAAVQNFNKQYCEHMIGNGVAEKPEKKIRKERQTVKDDDLNQAIKAAEKMLDEKPPSFADKSIWALFKDIEKRLPHNMSVSIVINGKK